MLVSKTDLSVLADNVIRLQFILLMDIEPGWLLYLENTHWEAFWIQGFQQRFTKWAHNPVKVDAVIVSSLCIKQLQEFTTYVYSPSVVQIKA